MGEVMIYMYVDWFWLRLFIIKDDLSYAGSVQTVGLSYLICHNFQFDVIFYSMWDKLELVEVRPLGVSQVNRMRETYPTRIHV